jgi:protein gp37
MNRTKINWADYTWNPITGCTKIAQGCKNCYAEVMFKRLSKMSKKYKGRTFNDVKFHPDVLNDPKLKSKKALRIFVDSMGDIFHEKISDDHIRQILDVIKDNPQHTFLVLTKRIKRATDWNLSTLKNLWLGYSASTQTDLIKGVDDLFRTNARIKWLSLEPLIGSIDLFSANCINIDWIVVGVESGNKRRPCYLTWIREIVKDCKENDIPVWVKQLEIKDVVTDNINDFPEDLRIRELPNV